MTLWRDGVDAWATLAGAGDVGPIRADILEKDYWATQVLRSLAETFANDFVFKGGTSLSKAYHCMDRFSEDIDILILSNGRSRNAVDQLMANMADHACSQLHLAADPQGRTRGRGTHRTERLVYPRDVAVSTGVLQPIVELEMGVRGSDLPPHAQRGIRPIIADVLEEAGLAIAQFADLASFKAPVLHPGRTLVEKVLMLHERVTTGRWLEPGRKNSPTQIGRHYHDIHRLLSLEDVRLWLEDRDEFELAVGDHLDVCRTHFGVEVPDRPRGGYGMSDAFRRDFSGSELLQRHYETAMNDLFIGVPPIPQWFAVIETIEASRSLL